MCDCGKRAMMPAQGTAKLCGHRTSHRGMLWCNKCAIMKRVCPRCGEARETKKPDEKK
jgi:hypothetical protein